MNITAEMVGFVLLVLSAVTGAWWRVESVVRTAKSEAEAIGKAATSKADDVAAQLAAYKTHVAENYASRVVLRESLEPLVESMKGLSTQVQHISERLDRAIDGQSKASRSRQP